MSLHDRAAKRAAALLVNSRKGVSAEALHSAVSDRVVVITGASEGIGREVARNVCAAGARAIVIARSSERLAELAAEFGPTCHPLPCDLIDRESVATATREIRDTYGHVDVVVSNAGKSIRRPIAQSYGRMHDFERLIGVNYLGPVALLLGLLPAMGEGGHIVNVSTVGVLLPPAPRWAGYVASKTAFDVWLRSAAAELAEDGITASSVYLALVHTRMSAPSTDFDNVPGLSPTEAAGVVCRAIVERRVSIAPWWATAAGAASGLTRRGSYEAMRRYGRRTATPKAVG